MEFKNRAHRCCDDEEASVVSAEADVGGAGCFRRLLFVGADAVSVMSAERQNKKMANMTIATCMLRISAPSSAFSVNVVVSFGIDGSSTDVDND